MDLIETFNKDTTKTKDNTRFRIVHSYFLKTLYFCFLNCVFYLLVTIEIKKTVKVSCLN